MKGLRRVLRVVALAVVGVAVGVSVNQIVVNGRWAWPWLAGALVLAVLAGFLDQWLGHREAGGGPRPVLWPGLDEGSGTPKRLGEVTPRDLGVHPSRFGAEGDSLYIRRDGDASLGESLADASQRVIIVQGPRLAGTTRTLAHGAQLHLEHCRVAGFVDNPEVPLADMITQAGRWAAGPDDAGAVLWLDAITPGRLADLALAAAGELPAGLRILVTLDTGELAGSRIPEQAVKLLGQHAVRVELMALTEHERRELIRHDVYATLRPILDQGDAVLVGRLMVAWEPLRRALALGGSEQATDRVALLRGVTDWYRAQLPRLLDQDALDHLYRAYRNGLTGAGASGPVSAAGFADALRWATAAPTADRPRLIDLQTVPGGQRYAPHPLLTVLADDPGEDVAWPIGDALWGYADRRLDGEQRRDIGYTALAKGAWDGAARLLDHPGTSIDPHALSQLAEHYYEAGDPQRAAHWWHKLTGSSDEHLAATAMFSLGVLADERGDTGQARHWYRKTIDFGHPDVDPQAMVNLGNLELAQGDTGQARHWYQRAADSGLAGVAPKGMVNLGGMEADRGDAEQARHWYQRAAESGDPEAGPMAMIGLGNLEYEQHNPEQARQWYHQAISSGHPGLAPGAWYGLGLLEQQQGDIAQARRSYREAAESGHPGTAPEAMFNLGLLEHEQGDDGQARHWWHRAVESGHPAQAPRAMINLGHLERQQGNDGQARHWWHRAVESGQPDIVAAGMVNLGSMEHEQGNFGQARRWYEQAASSGQAAAPEAMLNLGGLEYALGHTAEAGHWWNQVLNSGRADLAPRAMLDLGKMERQRGSSERARQWYQQAIDSGHAKYAAVAKEELRFLDEEASGQRRAEQFGRYGYLAYADPALMNRPGRCQGEPGRGEPGRGEPGQGEPGLRAGKDGAAPGPE